MTPVDQSYLEFVVPGGTETYEILDINISMHGKSCGAYRLQLRCCPQNSRGQPPPPMPVHLVKRQSYRRLLLVFDRSLQL